ncbi:MULTISPECIES: KTSC domain-containing protein [Aeromonas]|uniref:KTSC domain-containing protein n=1 Tax=Aeromonas TaxID=642 RepID=UPI00191ED501|nr:KTSC domain-containing protein [Aeromonas veronii]ELI6421054.1 KTSC domain-containing protein [Aeromonas veronii]MBL0472570.1 KTSC domain-containing protein [Aeromonas veronii]MCX0438662.1 KTSC domain-containing protein [Aeromonas veronii]MDX7747211.1 KTSC domain-containing protein [Aeromonas veronii]
MTEWIHVNSTAIRRVGYNAESMQMFIDFEESIPVYTFYNVPEPIFRSFVTARSVGQYYHQYIKGRYTN